MLWMQLRTVELEERCLAYLCYNIYENKNESKRKREKKLIQSEGLTFKYKISFLRKNITQNT